MSYDFNIKGQVDPPSVAWDGEQSSRPNRPARRSTSLKSHGYPIKSASAFAAEYVPLSYVIEPFLRSSSLYTLTARTGHGKTGFLTVVALAVATGRGELLGLDVQCGRVVYIACENPDDVRMRFISAAFLLNVDLHSIADNLVIIDQRRKPEEIEKQLRTDAHDFGPFALVIADTLAAMFDGKDINDSVQGGEFMRRLRPLTQLPGNPSVIAAAHPVKNASEEQLVPYGSGAILNETDGNLTLWKRSDTGTVNLHWQGKLRGLEFKPVPFRFDICASPDMLDAKGRQVEMPTLRPSTDEAVEDRQNSEARKDVILLKHMLDQPDGSQREWSAATGISLSGVARRLRAFEKKKLAESNVAGQWRLTVKGIKEAEALT